MPRKNTEKTAPALDPNAFALAEYNSLRAELLKYRDYQHQAIQLAFIAAGTFFSLNAGAGIQPLLLLAYPISHKLSTLTICQEWTFLRNRVNLAE
jgi:hypothetical protein